MPNPIVQSVFSDTVLGILRSVILAVVPDSWDWLPSTVLTIVSIVDDIDALDVSGNEKMNAVVDIVTSALDEADEVPGWSDLSEESRDGLIYGITEIVVFTIRCVQSGGLPDRDGRVAFADALRDLTLAVFDLVDAYESRSTTPTALAEAPARVRERLVRA